MKIDLLDWVIEKLKLSSDEEIEKPKIYGVNEQDNSNKYVFIKRVQSYEDCRCIIDEVRSGTICIFIISPTDSIKSQVMFSYIQGALFALNIELNEVEKNVYLISKKVEKA